MERKPDIRELWPSVRLMRGSQAMFDILEADIVVFQEAKIQRKDLQDDMVLVPGWDCYFSLPRQKKGYSGVVIYTRSSKCAAIRAEEGITGTLCPPNSSTPFRQLTASEQIGGYPSVEQMEELSEVDPATLDSEGRCLIVEFPAFVLIGVYCPANRDESRDGFRLGFLSLLEARVRNLIKMGKRVILTGDLNISPAAIDSAPATERIKKNTETEEEYVSSPARRLFNGLVRRVGSTEETHDIEASPVLRDLCREFHPNRTGMYTCWEQRVNARPGNYGSRIDYILCSDDIRPWFVESNIQEGLMGSDHCPVYASISDTVPFEGRNVHILDIMNPTGAFEDGVEQPRSNKITPLPLSGKLIPEFDRRRNIKDMFRNHSLSRTNSEIKASIATDTQAGLEMPDPVTAKKSALENKSPSVTMNPPSKRSHSKAAQTPPSKRLKPKSRPAGARSNGQQTLAGFFKSERTSRAVSEENATTSSDSPQEAQTEARLTLTSGLSSTMERGGSLPTRAASASPDSSVASLFSQTESWSKMFTKKPVPKCEGHDEDCISLVTKKPGINCGRSFWICSRPLGPSGDKESGTPWRCPTFIWCSDWRSS
uniref:DNA-(apurinic or apyrimidinic site) endonuclease 2 n=1 Tax=Arthroderma gypseum TaxID=63402 RepID=C6GBN6_ARTGY|nr:APN2 [Nannizzia gypsea]